MAKRKRYRYVLNGMAMGGDKLSSFRLIASNKLNPSYEGCTALRVLIPDDVELEKWSCDPYSTTDDERTLDELGYDVMVFSRDRWRVHNELKGIMPCDMSFTLLHDMGIVKSRWDFKRRKENV